MEINPEKNPMKNRRIKRCHTEWTNPIRRIDSPIPRPEIIRILFLPYLSPIFPQIGEKIKAETKVTPNVSPDQC